METRAALNGRQISFCLELAGEIWLWRDKGGKAEEGNFCVVGHFQFTQFDLQDFVVGLNKIMFEFRK